MDLFIVRHAWAEESGADWPDDTLRPLTRKGRNRFARMTEKLVSRGFEPRIIATSPLVRCVQTAEILAEVVGDRVEIVPIDALAPGGDPQSLLRWTEEQALRFEQIAWVGHAPDVNHLTGISLGGSAEGIEFNKGAIAAIRFEDALQFGQGRLRWLITAKILGC
jgi:phosphohistidine phosphatase